MVSLLPELLGTECSSAGAVTPMRVGPPPGETPFADQGHHQAHCAHWLNQNQPVCLFSLFRTSSQTLALFLYFILF